LIVALFKVIVWQSLNPLATVDLFIIFLFFYSVTVSGLTILDFNSGPSASLHASSSRTSLGLFKGFKGSTKLTLFV
jgi:hypothetical protein